MNPHGFTEEDAFLAEFFANWYLRRSFEHRANCVRNCPHFLALNQNEKAGRALALKIREAIKGGSPEENSGP